MRHYPAAISIAATPPAAIPRHYPVAISVAASPPAAILAATIATAAATIALRLTRVRSARM